MEINPTNAKKIIVGVIYRPPDSDLDVFEGKLEDILFSINKKNKDCVILGDFNIDVSKDEVVKRDFVNTLHSFSFFLYHKSIYQSNALH